jgi:sulfite dehydrogenase (cytochrome) subunit B
MRTPLLFSQAVTLAAAALIMVGTSCAKVLTYVLPEETATLRPGPGMETAQNNCLTCHSVDYVNTQPPNRGKAFWEAEVTKTIKVYRAPINDSDAKAIADYLAKTY